MVSNNITKFICCIVYMLCVLTANGQEDTMYANGVHRAINLYHSAQYLQSAKEFSRTFAAYGAGYNDDRYTAACSWALAGNKDSAFYQLNRIATKGNFDNIDRLLADDDLESLHSDPRWKKMFARVQRNKDKASANKP